MLKYRQQSAARGSHLLTGRMVRCQNESLPPSASPRPMTAASRCATPAATATVAVGYAVSVSPIPLARAKDRAVLAGWSRCTPASLRRKRRTTVNDNHIPLESVSPDDTSYTKDVPMYSCPGATQDDHRPRVRSSDPYAVCQVPACGKAFRRADRLRDER